MRDNQNCQAIRINDELCCARCGLSWAADDAERPECRDMMIPPVAPVQRVMQSTTPAAWPEMLGFVARVQDVTEHTPNRSINLVVFAADYASAKRSVDLMLAMPTQWRALRIEINMERVPELDRMARLGMKRVACTHAEIAMALRILEPLDAGYWRCQRLTPGLAAVQEIRSWLR